MSKEEQLENIEEILETYGKHELPYDIDDSYNHNRALMLFSEACFNFRNNMINIQGYPIITKRLCKSLAEFIGNRKVLEVMSGKGALAKGLIDEGINIKPTDNFSWEFPRFFNNLWTDIENINALDAIKKYAKDYDILLASWMPYNDPIAYDILLEMRKQNPNMIMLYIGEDWGGCCACDKFFEAAQRIENKTIEDINENVFRVHYGIHDEVMLFN